MFHPLIALDKRGALIQGRFVPWERVHSVEDQHTVTTITGDFFIVTLSFFDAQGRRIARVSLPKERCGVTNEEQILEFIAARLGRRFQRLAPRDPD